MKKVINMLDRLINKLNNMSDRDKMILGYICITLLVLVPMVGILGGIIKLIQWIL